MTAGRVGRRQAAQVGSRLASGVAFTPADAGGAPKASGPHIARWTMIGPATTEAPHTERTPVRAVLAGVFLVPGNVVEVLITD